MLLGLPNQQIRDRLVNDTEYDESGDSRSFLDHAPNLRLVANTADDTRRPLVLELQHRGTDHGGRRFPDTV